MFSPKILANFSTAKNVELIVVPNVMSTSTRMTKEFARAVISQILKSDFQTELELAKLVQFTIAVQEMEASARDVMLDFTKMWNSELALPLAKPVMFLQEAQTEPEFVFYNNKLVQLQIAKSVQEIFAVNAIPAFIWVMTVLVQLVNLQITRTKSLKLV